jgi:hypothetical protein
VVVAMALGPLAGVILLFKRGIAPETRRWTEMWVCLSACCLLSFLAAVFGDTWDIVKHLFIFNLLLDTCLVFAVTALWTGAFPSQGLGKSEH